MTRQTLPNESAGYRQARNELLTAEIDLRARIEQVAAMRRKLPPGGALKQNYAFEEFGDDTQVRTVKMSDLFEGSKTTLFVYSFMYGPKMERACPMCSSFLDALDGNARHIAQRISIAVVARSPVQRIVAFSKERGWKNLRLLSSAHNTYNIDYLGENATGDQMPMANVFLRRNGSIYHFWGTEMLYAEIDGQPRHMDIMWPLWNVLDTTPEGRGEWYPSLSV